MVAGPRRRSDVNTPSTTKADSIRVEQHTCNGKQPRIQKRHLVTNSLLIKFSLFACLSDTATRDGGIFRPHQRENDPYEDAYQNEAGRYS